MPITATATFPSGVLPCWLRRALSRAPCEVPAAAALHSPHTVLIRIPLARAYRAAGSTMMDETLPDAVCEANRRSTEDSDEFSEEL